MSRDQQNQTFDTAQAQNKKSFDDSQHAYQSSQDAIAKYVAENPYAKGGEFDTDMNAKLSQTASVGADATRTQLQDQALRTGQNMTAANATAEAGSQAATRQLAADEASADQQRIAASDARGPVAINAETQLYNGSSTAAGNALNTQETAAKQPSWMDEFGSAAAGALGQIAVSGAQAGIGKIPCWIAAELYGGWNEPRTILIREWLLEVYQKSFIGHVAVSIYRLVGERVADAIHRHPWMKRLFRPLFDKALLKATAWKGGI